MARIAQRTWVCPFYKFSEGLCVHCEGGGRAVFPDLAAEEEYVGQYCGSYGWERCSLAANRVRYYERTGNEPPKRGRPRKTGQDDMQGGR